MIQSDSSDPAPAPKRECWVVTDGRAGIENQALGLAEAIARRLPLHPTVKRIVLKAPWRSLPRQVWGEPFSKLSSEGALLRPPYPDLWIACGRASVPFTMAVKDRSPSTFTVQLQNPRAPLAAFDLVVPPTHDGLAGANVFPIVGSPGRATREKMQADAALLAPSLAHLPSPRVGVLIGGPNKVYRFSKSRRAKIAMTLRGLADSGAGLMITPSRRTEPETLRAIAEALEGRPHFLWDGAPLGGLDNPYFGILGLAEHVLVTADSVNMTTEAALTGKPVQMLALDTANAVGAEKFARFRKDLRKRRVARFFTDRLRRWSYEPLDETARAAEEVVRRLNAQRDAQ
ncbi:MAG: mitochondrial fission ELM1 family protein [Amphiplicatus sp.]